jgi:hypothetical protein
MSSTQMVVKTTISRKHTSDSAIQYRNENAQRRTGGSKLGIQPFPLYTLEAQAHAHECETNERQKVRPSRITPITRNTRLAALPDGECSSHREQGLNESTTDVPNAFRRPYPVPYPANECSEVESDQRT